jgi:DNA-binding NtrC family response regulator
MDFHLPGMTGLELFQQLVSMRPLPAILMSGLASAEEAAAAQHAGFFTFLRKPLDLARLRLSIEQLIQTQCLTHTSLLLHDRPRLCAPF